MEWLAGAYQQCFYMYPDLTLMFVLFQALNSIKKYPLPLTSGQEAKILDHVGMQTNQIQELFFFYK